MGVRGLQPEQVYSQSRERRDALRCGRAEISLSIRAIVTSCGCNDACVCGPREVDDAGFSDIDIERKNESLSKKVRTCPCGMIIVTGGQAKKMTSVGGSMNGVFISTPKSKPGGKSE